MELSGRWGVWELPLRGRCQGRAGAVPSCWGFLGLPLLAGLMVLGTGCVGSTVPRGGCRKQNSGPPSTQGPGWHTAALLGLAWGGAEATAESEVGCGNWGQHEEMW